jgi:hypothetical protein
LKSGDQEFQRNFRINVFLCGGVTLMLLVVYLSSFSTSMRGHSRYEIPAFLLGAGVAWLATYFSLTRERRLVLSIRSDAEHLASYHRDLLPKRRHYRGVAPPPPQRWYCGDNVITDEEILAIYRWAKEGRRRYELPPARLTAERIVCEKMLGLPEEVAIRAAVRGLRDPGEWEDLLKIVKLESSIYDRIKEENPGASEAELLELWRRPGGPPPVPLSTG